MKKGVYNMPNIYVNERKWENIYFIEKSSRKKNPKKTISQGMTKVCIKRLNKGINEFTAAVVEAVLQEK